MAKNKARTSSPRQESKITIVNLKFDEMPAQWYNILPDLPEPLPPPRDPEGGPSRVQNLPNLMIGECLQQEFSTERWIDIPGGIMDLYVKAGRPRPLFRATNLEKRLDTPARLYYKSEFFSPTGSHKVNTALAQC
jgi:tryptophan synthase beta chain